MKTPIFHELKDIVFNSSKVNNFLVGGILGVVLESILGPDSYSQNVSESIALLLPSYAINKYFRKLDMAKTVENSTYFTIGTLVGQTIVNYTI